MYSVRENWKEQYERKKLKQPDIQDEEENYVNILLDTMILIRIARDKENLLLDQLLERYRGKKLIFCLLEDILEEWAHTEKYNHGIENPDFEEKISRIGKVESKLNKIGKVREIGIKDQGYNKKYKAAEKLFKEKKYVNLYNNVPLSFNDCLLLKYTIDNIVTLVTRDKLLVHATETEIKKTKNRSRGSVFKP